ncbi:MAG: alpha/beta hydrolase [Gammaproteobacteria bacterium]|nr:alpha/beta hydrolase [Gammaproteobacteria bacterium]
MSDIPQWFWDAVDQKPSAHAVAVDDADINYLSWSDDNALPGLMFVHGHNAHAHWWDFIAPGFSDNYHTVALDLSGMGDSDHRDAYSADGYAGEILAVMDAAGLGPDTVVVAHSFGGIMGIKAAAMAPGRLKGLVLLDTGVKHPDDIRPREPERVARAKVYPEFDIAKSRFRLQPPQQCDNPWIVEYIARHSIEHIDEGWVWKFDEEHSMRMQPVEGLEEALTAVGCPMALIYGELSESFSSKSAEYMKSLYPGLDVYELRDARHHLFLDQPQAFMAQLKAILDGWA